jgi:protoporphyrin/coproporphyrin ferrochelatase
MKAVLLINMGGPESPKELKQFLNLMFLDKLIIAAPWFVRKMLSFIISNTRYKKSWKRYELIGGTPLKKDTYKLCYILQKELGSSYQVKPCYSYSHPFICEVIKDLYTQEIDEIIALPLYPQFSITTSQSVIDDVRKNNSSFKIGIIREFYKHPLYIDFWHQQIKKHININNLIHPHLLFSAHSIPTSYIHKGDPYQKQIEASANLISDSLHLSFDVSYQSGMNPKTWLGPATVKKIEKLISEDKSEIVIIPISFVGENLETLYDLDNVIIPMFKNSSSNVSRVVIQSDHPVFIKLLKSLVYEYSNK